MSDIVRVYLVEDEFVYRKKLHNFIYSIQEVSFQSALHIISIEKLDFFFSEQIAEMVIDDNDIFIIDIDLKRHFSGIEIAKKIRGKNKQCFIVFLTNMENKAIEIINQNINALSYIIKGTELDQRVIENIFTTIKKEIVNRTQNTDEYISFKKFGKIIFIKYKDIIFIQSAPTMRNMLIIKTSQSEQIVEGTINKLKKQVNVPYLYTDLRSFIINLTRISSLSRSEGIIIFDDGNELEVGARIINKLKQAL
ncbi:LytR/AlgR family response regulator transcription factor [Enterococcus sp. LJL99]